MTLPLDILAFAWPDPVLAIDGGTVGVIVFLTISFISWIMNTIQASQAKQQAKQRAERRQARGQAGGPPRGQQGGGGNRVKSEIEMFLEEVTGQPAKQQQPAQRPRPPKPPQPPKRVATPAPKKVSKPPSQPPRLPAEAPSRKPLSTLGQHVSSYMSDRIGEHVQQDIGQHVSQHITGHVSEHIGRETATDDHIRPPRKNQVATEIRELLRDADGVRKAIIVNEILTRRTFRR